MQQSNDLSNELLALNKYLEQHNSLENNVDKLLESKPLYRDLISSYCQPTSDEITNWLNEPYEACKNHPEQLVHKTISGQYVRSKSESLIYTLLHTNNIPFKYECPLKLSNKTIYPDFTIYHPITGDLYYLEHFGMIDKPEYLKGALEKIKLYISNGIIPTVNLIMTFETNEQSLDIELVQKYIEHYFK